MSSGITMSNLIDVRTKLMEHWEQALEIARQSGYWRDAEACARVADAFHEEVCEKLTSGAFSGDAASALASWEKCQVADREYRSIVEAEARLSARKPDGSDWWEVLGVAPSSP